MATALVLMVHHYWRQLFDTDHCPAFRGLLVWTAKGVALPFAVWIVLNTGVLPGVPILLPEVAILRDQGGPWFRFMLAESAPALFVTASFWTAVTLVSLLPAVVTRFEDPKDFKIHAGFWSLFLLPLSAAAVLAFGGWGAGAAMVAWLAPIIQVSLTATLVAKRPPSYGAAFAKLNFGNYPDAEQEILRELEKCEDDFDGWMMLANLYANKFDDLPEADRMIRELCGQPNVGGIQTSLALHRLADWHLKRGDDPASARSALEEICLRLPGTHFERMARQRIDQLPANREELIEQRTPRMIRLPALNDDLDDSPPARPADRWRIVQVVVQRRQADHPRSSLLDEFLAVGWQLVDPLAGHALEVRAGQSQADFFEGASGARRVVPPFQVPISQAMQGQRSLDTADVGLAAQLADHAVSFREVIELVGVKVCQHHPAVEIVFTFLQFAQDFLLGIGIVAEIQLG